MSSIEGSARSSHRNEEDGWIESNWDDFKLCYCGKRCPLRVSWTASNPGRRFWSCRSSRAQKCKFFEWKDPSHSAWSRQVILHLMAGQKVEEASSSIAVMKESKNEEDGFKDEFKVLAKRMEKVEQGLINLYSAKWCFIGVIVVNLILLCIVIFKISEM